MPRAVLVVIALTALRIVAALALSVAIDELIVAVSDCSAND